MKNQPRQRDNKWRLICNNADRKTKVSQLRYLTDVINPQLFIWRRNPFESARICKI